MRSTSLLIYGQSGSGKSSITSELIKLALKEKLRVKVILAEESLPIRKLSEIEAWDITYRDYPFEAIRHASEGYWPQDRTKAKSPLSETEADLWVFEGLSTMAELLMGSTVPGGLAARYARGMEIGQEEKTVRFKDGEQQIGGNPRTHYGVVQRWMLDCMSVARKLPGIKLWTAHELRVTDEKTSMPIVGPEIIGEAKTKGDSIPRLFGSMFHTELTIKGGKLAWKLHLGPHQDSVIASIICRAKTEMDAAGETPLVGKPAEIATKLVKHLELFT